MKCKKFLFIAMIFLVSLLCVSAVSAADDAEVMFLLIQTMQLSWRKALMMQVLKTVKVMKNILKDDSPQYEISFIYLKNLVNSDEKEIELPSDIEYKDSDNLKVGVKTKKYTITLKQCEKSIEKG